MSRVLAIDRGNSSVKGALIDDGTIVTRWKAGNGEAEIGEWILEARPEGAAVSSVVRAWNELCGSALRSAGVANVIFASHDSPWPFALDIDSPGTIGPDRLCAAAAVACLGLTDAVIIDAGTAVTVDLLTGGRFAGGAIMPGLGMMLGSLSERTSALPRIVVGPAGEDVPPGRDTAAAIRAGVLGAFIGGTQRLLELSAGRFAETPPVFLTGGDAGLLAGSISPSPQLYPDLVFDGLNCLYYRQF
jgi:type III pantothenate kinase